MGKRARRVRSVSPLVCSSSNYEREGQVFHVKHSAAPHDLTIARVGRPMRPDDRASRTPRTSPAPQGASDPSPVPHPHPAWGAGLARARTAPCHAGRAPRSRSPLRAARPRLPPPGIAPALGQGPASPPSVAPRSLPRASRSPAAAPSVAPASRPACACYSRALPRLRLSLAPAPAPAPAPRHRASVWPRPRLPLHPRARRPPRPASPSRLVRRPPRPASLPRPAPRVPAPLARSLGRSLQLAPTRRACRGRCPGGRGRSRRGCR